MIFHVIWALTTAQISDRSSLPPDTSSLSASAFALAIRYFDPPLDSAIEAGDSRHQFFVKLLKAVAARYPQVADIRVPSAHQGEAFRTLQGEAYGYKSTPASMNSIANVRRDLASLLQGCAGIEHLDSTPAETIHQFPVVLQPTPKGCASGDVLALRDFGFTSVQVLDYESGFVGPTLSVDFSADSTPFRDMRTANALIQRTLGHRSILGVVHEQSIASDTLLMALGTEMEILVPLAGGRMAPGASFTLLFMRAWGDCFVGCYARHRWAVTIKPSSKPDRMGHYDFTIGPLRESGAPLEEGH